MSLICKVPLSWLVAFIAFLNVCMNLLVSPLDEGWYRDTCTCQMPLIAVKTAGANCGPLSMTNCSGILYDPNKLRKVLLLVVTFLSMEILLATSRNDQEHFSHKRASMDPSPQVAASLSLARSKGVTWLLVVGYEYSDTIDSSSKSLSMLGHQTFFLTIPW